MLVSILVPLFNKDKFIQKTLESVINQSFQLWELIIVDDGSTDSSLTRVQEFIFSLPKEVSGRIKIFTQENKGQSSARYKAFCEAKGNFIALLDGDDLWSPRKLELQLRYFEKYPETDLLLTNYCIFPEDGSFPKAVSFSPVEKKVLGWANMEYFGGLVESTGMLRAEFLRQHMRPDAPAMSGGLAYCLYALRSNRIGCIDEYLCAYVENSRGWHLRKDDLIASIETLTKRGDLSDLILQSMTKGLKMHLFFWGIRKESVLLQSKSIIEIILMRRFDFATYALKTLYRMCVSKITYVLIRSKIRDLRSLIN